MSSYEDLATVFPTRETSGPAAGTEQVGESEKEESAKNNELQSNDPNMLDLAFAMDCTGSMGSYIDQAKKNIRSIVEDIVSSEKADINLALVEYRDHPPQDSTFVTNVHDFSPSVKKMKGWLDACSATGGGDRPEAVADALHQVLKLSWRKEAAKICVFISDAPPHGLGDGGDSFPNGCPNGLDPMVTANEIAEKGITMYMVGCEPAINSYRDWFMAIAHITNGQYVPLANSTFLSTVIIGGAKEELALQRLLETVNEQVVLEAEAHGTDIDEEELSKKVHARLQSEGHMSHQLQMNNQALEGASSFGKQLAGIPSMSGCRKEMEKKLPSLYNNGYGGLYSAPMKSFRSEYPSRETPMAAPGSGFGYAGYAPAHPSFAPVPASFAPAQASYAPAPASYAPAHDTSYSSASVPLQYEQASRMVSKAMKMNRFK